MWGKRNCDQPKNQQQQQKGSETVSNNAGRPLQNQTRLIVSKPPYSLRPSSFRSPGNQILSTDEMMSIKTGKTGLL